MHLNLLVWSAFRIAEVCTRRILYLCEDLFWWKDDNSLTRHTNWWASSFWWTHNQHRAYCFWLSTSTHPTHNIWWWFEGKKNRFKSFLVWWTWKTVVTFLSECVLVWKHLHFVRMEQHTAKINLCVENYIMLLWHLSLLKVASMS